MLGLVCIRVAKYRAIALRVAACAESSVQCVALRWCACVLGTCHMPCRLCCGHLFMGLRCRSAGRPIEKPVFLFIIITHSTNSTTRQALGSRQLAPPLDLGPRPRHIKDERRATKMSSENKEAAAPKRVESDVYDRQIRLWGADAQVRTTFRATCLDSYFGLLHHPHFCWLGVADYITCKLLRGPSTIHIHRVIVMSPPTKNPLPAACHGVRSRPLREFERCVLGDSQKFGPRRHSRRHL